VPVPGATPAGGTAGMKPAPHPTVPPAVTVPKAGGAFVPEPPPVPRPKSKFEETVEEIFRKIASWILVGEEHRPRNVSMEFAVASTWLLRIGVIALVACVAYFLKWSIDRGWVSPVMRVAMSMVAGAGMLFWGMSLLGKKYHLIGQGLLGGGLLTLYFSSYGAGPLYHLVPVLGAFALMGLVTAAAGVVSTRFNSLLIAILGLVGGHLTPVILRTETPNLPGLYAYLLLLNLGILAVAHLRQWRLLNCLGFLFSGGVFLGSMTVYTREDFPAAMGFLAVFFAIHAAIVYVYNVMRARPSTVLEIIHLLINTLFFAIGGYALIETAHGGSWPAVLSVSLAAFFAVHAAVFVRKRLVDRNLLVAFIALSAGCAVWTFPLLFEKETLTVAFALLAFAFLWIGQRVGSHFLENAAYGLYVTMLVRLLFLDLPRNFDARPAAAATLAEYAGELLRRAWTFGIAIGAMVGAFLLCRRESPSRPAPVLPGNDVEAMGGKGLWMWVFQGAAALVLFLVAQLEFNTMFQFWPPFRLPILTVLWCVMAAWLFWRFLSTGGRNPWIFAAFFAFLAGAIVKLLVVDVVAWSLDFHMIYEGGYTPVRAVARLADYGVVIAVLLGVWRLFPSPGGKPLLPRAIFGYGGLALFFLYVSLETNNFLDWKLPEFRVPGVSVLWACFAIACVTAGILRTVKALRYAGLGLFAVVVFKVFLVDLARTAMIYRVIAFMVLGCALLLGSFLYIRFSGRFQKEDKA
ncbi:MAG: DUF2339 domain-containing protein, partial [Planctomycetota bacterium]